MAVNARKRRVSRMSNHAHLRPGHVPDLKTGKDPYKFKRPVYKADIRLVRQRVLSDPRFKDALGEEAISAE
jgi:hypothetical protein